MTHPGATPTEPQVAAPRTEGPTLEHWRDTAAWLAEEAVLREAAPRAEEPDYEALRMERGWPTPNHMRHAADALDMLVIAKYGDVLRWVADLCDESLSRPSDERVGEET